MKQFKQLNKFKSFFLAVFFVLIGSSLSMANDLWKGPFEIKNQFPLTSDLLSPEPEKASIYDKDTGDGTLSLSYSSIYIFNSSPSWDVGMDMEIAELTYSYRRGITDYLEVGGEVPVLSFRGGFMDSFLSDYHRLFGFPDYGRSERPRNSFLYYLRRDGKDIILPEDNKIGLGDISLYGKFALKKGDPNISVKLMVEAPTGNAKKGFGNGSWDYGISLLMDKELLQSVKLYGGVGLILPGNLKGYEKIHLNPYPYGFIALEKSFGDWSLIGQMQVAKSPFPKTGIKQIDNIAVSGTGGVKYRISNNHILSFSLSEDVNLSGAPDVTFNLSLKEFF